MASTMTPTQIRDFLSGGTRTGKLAVVGADGAARVVPVWFVLDGDDLVFDEDRCAWRHDCLKSTCRSPSIIGGDGRGRDR